MKCAFTFNGQYYISPSKRQAIEFLKMFGAIDVTYRFKTKWKFKTIEKAPSYCQMMVIRLDNVEFKSLE